MIVKEIVEHGKTWALIKEVDIDFSTTTEAEGYTQTKTPKPISHKVAHINNLSEGAPA